MLASTGSTAALHRLETTGDGACAWNTLVLQMALLAHHNKSIFPENDSGQTRKRFLDVVRTLRPELGLEAGNDHDAEVKLSNILKSTQSTVDLERMFSHSMATFQAGLGTTQTLDSIRSVAANIDMGAYREQGDIAAVCNALQWRASVEVVHSPTQTGVYPLSEAGFPDTRPALTVHYSGAGASAHYELRAPLEIPLQWQGGQGAQFHKSSLIITSQALGASAYYTASFRQSQVEAATRIVNPPIFEAPTTVTRPSIAERVISAAAKAAYQATEAQIKSLSTVSTPVAQEGAVAEKLKAALTNPRHQFHDVAYGLCLQALEAKGFSKHALSNMEAVALGQHLFEEANKTVLAQILPAVSTMATWTVEANPATTASASQANLYGGYPPSFLKAMMAPDTARDAGATPRVV